MAFGLPAIGTTAGAASEIITDGKTGFLIEPGDSKTLAERLSRLTNDRELLARMSVNALGRYRQQPTWNETARRIREFLGQIVGNSGAVKQSPKKRKIMTPPDSGSQ
jgi:glycosyltransferase involved in cell wall biosynthesis